MTVTKTIYYYKQFTILKFTGTGSITVLLDPRVNKVDYLIVAGGGSGGSQYGGGGGAGGLLEGTGFPIKNPLMTITVGAGGASVNAVDGNNGSNSSFGSIVAIGGGGGGATLNPPVGKAGGSGGGGGLPTTAQEVAGGDADYLSPRQGYDGGTGNRLATGGGGGAGQVGENNQVDGTNYGGDGGNGISSNITGTPTYYAGGGGGCGWAAVGEGGLGGGGNGSKISTTSATAGTNGLGGGGGGGTTDAQLASGAGGSGIVIIRYLTPFDLTSARFATPSEGTLYVIDPIDVTAKFSASTNNPTFCPPVSEATVKYAASAPITLYQCIINATAKFSAKVFAKIFVNLATLNLQEITVSKNLQDRLWNCNTTIDDYYDLDLTTLRNIQYAATDHLGVSHPLFTGIVPQSSPVIAAAANKTPISGYDYAWYLTQQYVPSTYQHNPATTNPATIVLGLLGGNDWATTTGIEPYNIDTVAEWGTTLASRVFDFDRTTTKMQAIEKICAYCRYIFIVKWRDLGGGFYQPTAYFINETAIDTDLDLPAAVTITAPDSYLDGKVRLVNKAEERYNRVTVIGRNPAGTVYTQTYQSAGVTNGDELAVEYVENSRSWTTQAQVDARCLELYNLYITPSKTYTATFRDRFDLQYLQQIRFSGYSGIATDWMRIISIKYQHVRGAEKTVEVQFTTNVKFSDLQRMYRTMEPDPVSETESIFDAKMAQVPTNEVGTVTAIDGNTATITLEDGRIVTARIIT